MKRAPLWLEIPVGLCLLALIFAIVFPVFAQRKTSGPNPCIRHIKRMAVALLVYANENDERVPPTDWMDALKIAEADRHCPDARDNQFGYAMNAALLGGPITILDEHSVSFFETDMPGRSVTATLAAIAKGRHGSGSHMAWLDGSVRFRQDADHAERIAKDPRFGVGAGAP